MKKSHLLLRSLLVVMVMGQTSIGAVALADSDATPSPTPSVTVTPQATPSDSPAPSDSPTPTATATPTPQASPSPSVTPTPSSSPTPSPTPATGSGKAKKDCPATGPCDPTGVIPSWVYNTATGKWEEADKTSFIYDTASGYYLSPKYYLDKQLGWYEIVPVANVAALPANFVTAPNVVHTSLGDVVVGSKDYELAKALGIIPSGSDATISGTGAGSTNAAGITNSNQSWFDLTNLVNVINTLDTTAKSGDVSATSNTNVGNAVTGAANVLANLINLLSSAWSWSNGGLNMFMQNLFGNINGDITLSPNQTVTGGGSSLGSTTGVSNTGSNSTNDANVTNSNTLGVNASNTGNIVNNVNANATSGNADATKNTNAGDVASGNATAEINIINLINSYISSGNSFFGVLNIFGNLNGDILFPNGFLNGALSSGAAADTSAGISGTGPDSSNQAGVTNANNSTVHNTSNYGLDNNINAAATSGDATLGSNTSAGSATSGSASTTGSTFNLTNSSIFGDNAVLVIVNVLGHWVGKIMTLPGGSSTSALLTGNAQVASTGADSHNQAGVSNSNTTNVNQTNTGSITNNVNVNANSGDASATDNTKVGNVTTGAAKVSTGVTNIVNSVLNVKHWFGVLVINVFGDWLGDVGDNSSAGNPLASPPAASSTNPAVRSAQTAATANSAALASLAAPTSSTASSTAADVASPASNQSQVLAAAAQVTTHAGEAAHLQSFNLIFWAAAGLMLLAGATFGIERRLRRRP